MKQILGFLLIAIGILAGLYIGLYLCFIGGIIDIIKEVRAPEMSNGAIAWGVVKIMFAGVAGMISTFVFVIPGQVLMKRI